MSMHAQYTHTSHNNKNTLTLRAALPAGAGTRTGGETRTLKVTQLHETHIQHSLSESHSLQVQAHAQAEVASVHALLC